MIPDDLSHLFLPASGQSESAGEMVVIEVVGPLLLVLTPLLWVLGSLVKELVFGPRNR